jgi:hypothetical protein
VTGWTLIRDTGNGSAMHQLTYWKVMAAGDPTSYRWTFSTSQVAAGAILAYRGVDVNAPVEIHDAFTAANSKQITAPSVTSVYQGGLVLGLFGIAQQGTVTPPTAMFERAEIAAAGKTKIVCEIADAILQAAGPTGARTASASKAGANIGQIIVLRPATG